MSSATRTLAAAVPGTTLVDAADAAEVAQAPELAAPAPGISSATPVTTTTSAAATGVVGAQTPSLATTAPTRTSGVAAFSPGEPPDPMYLELDLKPFWVVSSVHKRQ